MSPSSLAAAGSLPAVERVANRIFDIATIPQVALRIVALAEDPASSAGDMRAAVESDPVLATRVLRLVNSSAVGLRFRVTNLQQAIAYLGVKAVRNVAMTASLRPLFAGDQTIGRYRRGDLWRHMVSVGIATRVIVDFQNLPSPDDAFLAGLLHDVGLILEDQYAHAGFCAAMNELHDESSLVEIERRHLGFDHCELGGLMARRWRFPESVVAAILHHHDAALCGGEASAVVACVEVANLICTLQGYCSVGWKLAALPQAAIDRLQLRREDISFLAEETQREIERNEAWMVR